MSEQATEQGAGNPAAETDIETGSAAAGPTPPNQLYQLQGTQVEPEASYWARCPVLRTVSRADVFARIKNQVPPYPPRESEQAQAELEQIRQRFAQRHEPLPQEQLSDFLRNPRFNQRPPVGAVLSERRTPAPIIATGAELASLFEDETPGLWHRHVLNVLLSSPVDEADPTSPLLRQVLSPTRQALIWHALETAISSALMAVWHYKWLARGLDRVAFRERPYEADNNLPILFDLGVDHDVDGNIRRDHPKPNPMGVKSPGTPRHPAYGSGHSTYSKAASEVLGCLLPDKYRHDFELLAENIGQARVWGGVHWQTDHEVGQLIGRAVGQLVIEQLNRTHISDCPVNEPAPPPRSTIEARALAFSNQCSQDGQRNFCRDCQFDKVSLQGIQG